VFDKERVYSYTTRNIGEDMSYLEDSFKSSHAYEGSICFHKNEHYAPIYDKLLAKYVGKEVILAEMGIGYGGCLQMWKKFLGDKAQIFGLDFHPDRFFEEDRIKCFLADQTNTESMLAVTIPEIDIFIDDGSHMSSDQIRTFEAFFPRVKSGGIYVCEDTNTSYREAYEGGYKKVGTFIEYCKDILDFMHYMENPNIPRKSLWNSIEGFSIYNGLAVFTKV
jgi:hypothetical protein